MKNKSKLIEIIQNATIIYTDNVEEHYEAIQITPQGVDIGRIIDNKFMKYGFIPKYNIKQIKNSFKKKTLIN